MEGDFDCWEKARVDPEVDFGGAHPVRTIFAYGSLIFRPGFPFTRTYPVCVRGFSRRFWQRSVDHRGTPEAPGRVLTLLRVEDETGNADPGSALVHGLAYEVAEDDWNRVVEDLDIRERHGYVRTLTELFPPVADILSASEVVAPCSIGQAVVYYAHEPSKSAAFAGPEDIDATAAVIATAAGPSGKNDEYLFKLQKALDELSLPRDAYLSDLSAAVRKIQASLTSG